MARARRAPTVKDEAPAPLLSNPRFAINASLFLIIGLEAGVVWLSKPSWQAGLIAVTSLVGSIWGVAAGRVASRLLVLVGDEKKELDAELNAKLKAWLQSPRLTAFLAVPALIGAVAAAYAFPWLLDPPLLWVLPRGVYNEMAEAPDVRDSGFRYVLKVEQGGKGLAEEVVTGRGSVLVGRDPERQLAWIGKDEREELKEQTRSSRVLDRWKARDFRKLVQAPVRKGCVELVLEYCFDGGCEEITRQPVEVKPKLNRVFLENSHETCQP